MKKNIFMLFALLTMSLVSFAISPITGTLNVCTGATTTLSDATAGGVWSSSDITIASVGPATGVVLGVSAGTVMITYTVGASYTVDSFIVSNMPAPISGPSTICTGASVTLTDATPGGTWSSSDYTVATAYLGTGVINGVAAGSAIISYYVGPGCGVTTPVTVDLLSAGVISGDTFVCTGSTTTLTESVPGGVWSSTNTSVATISGSGIVSGVAVGYTIISYTVSGACGITAATMYLNDFSSTFTGTITGPSSVELGGTIPLWSTGYGGVWSSSNPSVATINPTTGVVSGISYGTTTITYTVTGCTGTLYTTAPVSVYTSIYGTVNLPASPYTGSVKIWLITYNPATLDLEATDSAVVVVTGSSAPYYFHNVPADSIRIKAAIDTSWTGVGYIPTYHTSNFYWYNATVLNHTNLANDYGQDINMATGVVTAGPGFISGNVTTGANKGTSGAVPAKNLHICVVNAATNQIIQQTYTDNTGNYTFSNLPVGATYYVFPDSLHYITTAFTGITLTTANPSMTNAKFSMHTISHTITPQATAISTLAMAQSSVVAYPNPTSGLLHIQWHEADQEIGKIVITDLLGRAVFSDNIIFTPGSGATQIDLSSIRKGMYMLNIKSAGMSYTSKIVLE